MFIRFLFKIWAKGKSKTIVDGITRGKMIKGERLWERGTDDRYTERK